MGNNCELRILEYLLPSQEIEFNIAELAEEVGVSRITATRIVKKFAEWGVLKSPRTIGNTTYSINHESPIVKSVEQFNNVLIENILGDDTLYEIHDYWEAQRLQIPSDLVCTTHLIDFQNINWESLVPGVRYKTFIRGNKRLRLVEFSDTFIEYDWCTKRVDGNISIDFNGELIKFKSGDGLFIPGGEESRHKAMVNKGEKALLLLLEDT